jgi:hypothetical protein
MKLVSRLYLLFLCSILSLPALAQNASVKARVDAAKITVGDQVKLFIEATHNAKQSRLEWAVIPDTFNSLEVVEKGKIDTTQQGDIITYKQRLLITGFDSGSFKIPAFTFPVIPGSGTPYTLATDSFQLLVQTVPVDTTKGYKGIKEIITVKSTWRDYIWLIAAGALLVLLVAIVVIYFLKNKKTAIPTPLPKKPVETPQERAMRLLNELEQQQLWQGGRIKEYYVQLTDILRSYIEERFHTPALELTTDELLQKAKMHPELRIYYDQLANILYTGDLAKFAKAQPLPHEHTSTMDLTRQLIIQTKPVATPTQQPS